MGDAAVPLGAFVDVFKRFAAVELSLVIIVGGRCGGGDNTLGFFGCCPDFSEGSAKG